MKESIVLILVLFLANFAARAEIVPQNLNELLKKQTLSGTGEVRISTDNKTSINQNFSCSLKYDSSSKTLSIAGSIFVDAFWNIKIPDWTLSPSSSAFEIQSSKLEGGGYTLCDGQAKAEDLLDQARISEKKLEMRREFKCVEINPSVLPAKEVKFIKTASCSF